MSNSTKNRLLLSTILGGVFAAGLAATPAMAQQEGCEDGEVRNDEGYCVEAVLNPQERPADDDPETVVEQSQAELDTQADDTIVVTGSRIQRAGVDTFYPAVTVDAQSLDDNAFNNVADALNEIPSFGNPDATPVGGQNSFSTGQNFVDFLGLGAQRTLTLVNGRRFVSQNTPQIFGESGGLQVDFNVIPIALVERIETIGVGGAPIYGSDAIAGTINVITLDDFEGFEVTYQHELFEEGDGHANLATMVAGGGFNEGRGNVTMSLEFASQDALAANDRPNYTAAPNDADFLQVNRAGRHEIFFDRRIALVSKNGLVGNVQPATLFCQVRLEINAPCWLPTLGVSPFLGAIGGGYWSFDPNGNVVSWDPGARDPESIVWAIGGDGDDFGQDVTQLRSPLERIVATTQVNYEITPNIRFSSDFLFSNSSSDELVNQGGFQTWVFGGTSSALEIDANHPLLTAQARNFFASNGLSEFALHRFNNDIIDSSNSREQHVWRFTGGFDGDFNFADRNFYWEAFVVHGESDADTEREMIIDQRFINALDVVVVTAADFATQIGTDPNGNPIFLTERDILGFSGTSSAQVGDVVCRSALEAAKGNLTGASGSGITDDDLPFVTGCVPLDLFGYNRRSEAARDWVTGDVLNESDIEQTVYNANFGGELFHLPAGPLGFNVGFEAREERAQFKSATASQIALGRSAAILNTGGRYTTTEWYGETVVPLVSEDMNIPFLAFAEANGAFRAIENSISGDSEVWTVGGRFAPFEDIVFRGNYTESVRNPSLTELFSPVTSSFSFANDPCDEDHVDRGPNPAVRLANCIADLGPGYDPNTFESIVDDATVRGRAGGNPNLTDEKAESFSYGVTIEPRWIDNLTFTADYVDVTIDDAIVFFGLGTLMRACYDDPNFPNNACTLFERDAANQVVDFLTDFRNAAVLHTAQAQFSLNYSHDVADALGAIRSGWGNRDLGEFTFRARLNKTIDRETIVANEPPTNSIGGFGDPEWSGVYDFVWSNDKWRAFWRVEWTDDALIDPRENPATFFDLDGNQVIKTDDRYMHSASLSYRLEQPFTGAPADTIFQIGVDNVFDRDASVVEEAAGHFTTNDEVFGRTWTFRIRAMY